METIICPEHFRSKYLLKKKVPQDNRGPLDKGLVIHETFEKIMNARIAQTPLNINHVDEWLNDLMVKYPAAFEYMHDVLKPAAVNFMSRPSYDIPFYDEIEEAEKVFAIDEYGRECDYDDPNCWARAVLDLYGRTGDTAILIDHKSQLNVEPSNTRKMLFYAWMACRSDPSINKVFMILHFCHPDLNFFHRAIEISRADLISSFTVVSASLKSKLEKQATDTFKEEIQANGGSPTADARAYLRGLVKKMGRVVDIPFFWVLSGKDVGERRMRDEGLIADDEIVMERLVEEGGFIEEEIVAEVKYIEAHRKIEGEWGTVPNSKCEYCPAYYDCPARIEIDDLKTRAGISKLENIEEATAVLKDLMMLEAQAKDLKKALKAYLVSDFTKVPSVVVGDRQFTTRLSHTPDFENDRAAVKAFLKNAGQQPEDYMKFDTKTLNKFVVTLEDPDLRRQAIEMAPMKTSTRTQIYKL
jgi:hypothetical protein